MFLHKIGNHREAEAELKIVLEKQRSLVLQGEGAAPVHATEKMLAAATKAAEVSTEQRRLPRIAVAPHMLAILLSIAASHVLSLDCARMGIVS